MGGASCLFAIFDGAAQNSVSSNPKCVGKDVGAKFYSELISSCAFKGKVCVSNFKFAKVVAVDNGDEGEYVSFVVCKDRVASFFRYGECELLACGVFGEDL